MWSKPYWTDLISKSSKAYHSFFDIQNIVHMIIIFYTSYPWKFAEIYWCNICSDMQGTKLCYICQENYN